MSDTPRTDIVRVLGNGVVGDRTKHGFQIKFELTKEWVPADHARKLERELAAMTKRAEELQKAPLCGNHAEQWFCGRQTVPTPCWICALQQRAEEAERDAERLNYLDAEKITVYGNWTNSAMGSNLPPVFDGWATEEHFGPEGPRLFKTIRDAVDAARGKNG